MIRAVIFDLSGVLFTNGAERFKHALSERYNIPYSKVQSVIEFGAGTEYRKGKLSRDAFWKIVKDKLAIPDDIEVLENEWIAGYELIEETKEIVLELAKKYKIYYLSDNIKERIEKLQSLHNFIEWFEDGVFSHDVGLRKPDPKIYTLALEKARVKPEEAVFIDDKEINLPPAQQLGMKTILCKDPEGLRGQLKSLGLL